MDAENTVIAAIHGCKDIKEAVDVVAGDIPAPHPAFMIYPANERRKLIGCLIKPVSDWALDIVLSTLDSRGVEAAWEFYTRTEGSPAAASLRRRLWKNKVR
jgi:hypothetical protein